VPQHISRKELKKDEIRETLAHGAEAVISHQRIAAMVVAAAVLVAAAVYGWRFYAERQTWKASAALEEAMKVYEARIRAPGQPAEPGEVTYVQEKNKYEDAVKKFSEVARSFPRTRPGQTARYYAALSAVQLGRYDAALKELQELAASANEDYAALARYQMAAVYDRMGKGDEAVKVYRQLAQNPTVLVPKPLVLLTLADHLLRSNPQEAASLYNQIKKDFPDTPIAEEADKRLETLR